MSNKKDATAFVIRVEELLEKIRVLLEARRLGTVHADQIRDLMPARIFVLRRLAEFFDADASQFHTVIEILVPDAPPGVEGALWRLEREGYVQFEKGSDDQRRWAITPSGLVHWRDVIKPQLPSA
jgi:hypothetical protein